jgi:hypothetical protein
MNTVFKTLLVKAKSITTGQMVEGFLIPTKDMFDVTKVGPTSQILLEDGSIEPVKTDTICQYVGTFKKKKLYTGDITEINALLENEKFMLTYDEQYRKFGVVHLLSGDINRQRLSLINCGSRVFPRLLGPYYDNKIQFIKNMFE